MKKNSTEIKKDLKFLYKILNQRIGEEVREGYTVSNIFLLFNSGMVALMGSLVVKDNFNPLIIFLLQVLRCS